MNAQIERLEDRVYELEEQLGLREEIPPQLKLQPALACILGVLLKREMAMKETLSFAIHQGNKNERGNEPSFKCIEVQVCRLRKLLQPLGIKIETLHGRGYFMKREMKDKCRNLFAFMREAA